MEQNVFYSSIKPHCPRAAHRVSTGQPGPSLYGQKPGPSCSSTGRCDITLHGERWSPERRKFKTYSGVIPVWPWKQRCAHKLPVFTGDWNRSQRQRALCPDQAGPSESRVHPHSGSQCLLAQPAVFRWCTDDLLRCHKIACFDRLNAVAHSCHPVVTESVV